MNATQVIRVNTRQNQVYEHLPVKINRRASINLYKDVTQTN